MGGSHGGFLTAHLSSQLKVKKSVILNGVLYGPGILSGTSIPEWIYSTL